MPQPTTTDAPAKKQMRNWTVCIYGKLPEQLVIAAEDRQTAEEDALQIVLDGIEFHGHLAE